MIETNVKRKILELLREHEISPIERRLKPTISIQPGSMKISIS